jgi:hypothetical protein
MNLVRADLQTCTLGADEKPVATYADPPLVFKSDKRDWAIGEWCVTLAPY